MGSWRRKDTHTYSRLDDGSPYVLMVVSRDLKSVSISHDFCLNLNIEHPIPPSVQVGASKAILAAFSSVRHTFSGRKNQA